MPQLENIVRSLVLDFLAAFNPIEAMIWHLDKGDSLVLLASYGDHETSVGESIPGSVWRNDVDAAPFNLRTALRGRVTWFENNTQVVFNLYAQGLLIGFLLLVFADSIDNPEDFTSIAQELSGQISLYMALRFHTAFGLSYDTQTNNVPEARLFAHEALILTERQILVLTGIAAKKTNHEIAKDLGYSVSTVRHETMRIFEALGVSDRREATSKANESGTVYPK